MHQHFFNQVYQTRNSVSSGNPNIEKRVENMMCSRIYIRNSRCMMCDLSREWSHMKTAQIKSFVTFGLCGYRKYPYPPHGWSLAIPRGRGVSKANIYNGKYEAKLEIPGRREVKPSMGEVWLFSATTHLTACFYICFEPHPLGNNPYTFKPPSLGALPIWGGSSQKGYLFQAVGISTGRDFTIWSIKSLHLL